MVERLLLASRWLLAPLYLGLALLLLVFVAAFFVELWRLAEGVVAGADAHLTVSALGLLDIVLVAGLIVMVMLSGFETYVAKIDLAEKHAGLARLTQLGTGSVKVKIVGSIAVISAIYLLELFFEIDQVESAKLLWLIALHLVFVVTALLLALLDRLTEH
jgi:uncharacterized protein (TIGR00645 family)